MNKDLIVVTGGCGYIGSHTIIQLIESGFNVISIDNFSRSTKFAFEAIKQITGVEVENINIDLTNLEDTSRVFSRLGLIYGVIHFAAYKSVPESIKFPEKYYSNNISTLLNVLSNCSKNNIKNFVFSSSCSVYGDIATLPVSEVTPVSEVKSPYAYTKIIGERIVKDICNAKSMNAFCLRYFNPIGAHPSGLIGEIPIVKPDNLAPVITQTAIGKRKSMQVYGGNLDTRDGSCVRDYVHVMDIANAHVLALEKLDNSNNIFEVINLGTGQGVTVFEAIEAFEKISGIKLPYVISGPRPGDAIEIFSNVEKAKNILGWYPKLNIFDMMSSAWKWELELSKSNKQYPKLNLE